MAGLLGGQKNGGGDGLLGGYCHSTVVEPQRKLTLPAS
jgi:hypothetical protein